MFEPPAVGNINPGTNYEFNPSARISQTGVMPVNQMIYAVPPLPAGLEGKRMSRPHSFETFDCFRDTFLRKEKRPQLAHCFPFGVTEQFFASCIEPYDISIPIEHEYQCRCSFQNGGKESALGKRARQVACLGNFLLGFALACMKPIGSQVTGGGFFRFSWSLCE